ncbi:SLC35F4 (predicted) [Pycnogonum litorale]
MLDGGLGPSSNNVNNNNNEDESDQRKCCNETHQRLLWGILLCVCVAMSWVGATHLLKYMYVYDSIMYTGTFTLDKNNSATQFEKSETVYNAPFFTTWFTTVWTCLFFPFYLCARSCWCTSHPSVKEMYRDSVALFHAKGFTFTKFLTRCAFFTVLWVVTNYMYIHSLSILGTTDIIALYASNVSFVYLLSWVILHEQFVGIRIVAVILCNTGIALLAYMDGIHETTTLSGVVLAAAAACGSAVYKVLFKKIVGEVSVGQVSVFFTIISIFNTFLLWPIMLTLLLSGAEVIKWAEIPWFHLIGAVLLILVSNLLGTFGVILTYEVCITLGLVVAIPVSAALDISWYGIKFEGMKLSGIVLIGVGFMMVLLPQNWPSYLTRMLRWQWSKDKKLDTNRVDRRSSHSYFDTSYAGYRSRLRSPSTGLVR